MVSGKIGSGENVDDEISGLDDGTFTDIDIVDLIFFQNGAWAYENNAGREKIFRGTSYHSRAILNSGARVGYIVDYLKVLLIEAGFIWKGTFQDEHSRIVEDSDTALTFWLSITYFIHLSFSTPVTRTC